MQNNHLSLETIKRIALVTILCFIGALQRNTISACYDYSVKRPVEQSLRLGMSNDEFNRMTFTPITGAEYVSRNVVNFNGRKKGNNSKVTAPQHSSSAIKAIPVAVLIAMSPLNTSSVASEYSPMSVGQRVEMVPQTPDSPVKVRSNLIKSGNEKLNLFQYTTDDDFNTIERYYFNYKIDLGDKEGVLNGKLIAFCYDKDDNGRNLIAYQPYITNNKLGDMQLCYVSRYVGNYLYSDLRDSCTNNNAVGFLPMSEFTEFFGEDAVKNAPDIWDCVASYKDKE